ncbi:8399_t:CDS:2 [Ambispora gerdemannii]|uniref:8399_t:CDS:1 n=1 Tax=Ambispora gerdemannii TaxID=144530 RepID=A0A9N8ZA98_9GLOM|nr:8399_t:CDS:2 [Ambispora gerdemannii]
MSEFRNLVQKFSYHQNLKLDDDKDNIEHQGKQTGRNTVNMTTKASAATTLIKRSSSHSTKTLQSQQIINNPYPTLKSSWKAKKSRNKDDDDEFIKSLPPLSDVIAYNLDGIVSAKAGHHFANKGNSFYPCLVQSGLTYGKKVTFEDDIAFPRTFNYGITNLVNRVTRGSNDLNQQELRQGIPIMLEKVKKYHPKILCFIGKCVFDVFMQYNNLDPNVKKYGLQSIRIPCGRVVIKPEERLELFKELRRILDELKINK